jgi:large subunit ribosomal protein L4
METKIYNQKGKESGTLKLDEKVFGLPWNADLVHQVITSMMSNARKPIAHTKTRGEVRGGGKKPWRQKGTGRARHGSTRSPIWVGGGVAHGPRNDKNFERKVNKKMKAKALYTILSKKMRDGEVLFVDSLSFDKPKTKDAVAVLKGLSSIKGFETLATKRKNAAYIAIKEQNDNVKKSFGNYGAVEVSPVSNINPVDIMNYKYVVIADPEASVSFISGKMSPSTGLRVNKK